ncbi:dihydroxyacetone phosphate acyltransferase [Esox lucius]|uniref:Phospholipid/glycerol acyltransferase domain-containing protein n=1 Tax=Esox lucius TaxID=8010 RepID=A0A3P8ZPC9_ESOLU|nr:dihydroxyacetone phosphate acyltransferase [Esox lucius]
MASCEDPSSCRPEQGVEFIDLLEERRQGSDIGHAFRTFNPSPYRQSPTLTASALNRIVLESQYLRYVTQEVATETGDSVDLVREEASRIMEEMSQNLQLGFVRLLGFALSKVFKRLFSHINVNPEGLNRLQQAIQESPVILMPNHRSYVDFLVLSYILFTYDLPIPVIAAGIPLMDMKMIGEVFRRSGAFFIRRAIGTDKLYWAVLSEYVKTIVKTRYAPLEFYVEGLRSRTLKSLTPKLGMMHMVLEPFFKGEVYDTMLMPISISYDRVLEESLLAHELLGVPKPKETTMGLLKARQVLDEDYGSMHVYFGTPLSIRKLSQGRVDRCHYNLIPRDLPQRPSAETQVCVSWLAQHVIRVQEQGTVLSPWSLIACLLLQDLQESHSVPPGREPETGLALDLLTQRTLWLKGLALHFGARLDWPEKLPDHQVMSSSIARHQSVIRCNQGRVVFLEEEEGYMGFGLPKGEESVFRRAGPVLMAAAYRNQALHLFVRPAMVVLAVHATSSSQREDVYSYFRFLLDLFSNEFVFITDRSYKDFEESCSSLRECGAIQTSQQEVTSPEKGQKTTSFLRALLQPFIDTYQVVFSHLCEESVEVFTEKQMVPAVRSLATKLLLSGELRSYEALSSDTLKNVLSALLRLGAVTRLRTAEQSEFRAHKPAIRRIADTLMGRITPPLVQTVPGPRL